MQQFTSQDGHVSTLGSEIHRHARGHARWVQLAVCSLLMTGIVHAQTAPVQAKVPAGQTAEAASAARLRINVVFQHFDSQEHVILKYGAMTITTRLQGLKIRPGAAGVMGMFLPEGASLQAEIVEKGAIPGIILWKGKVNLNEQLLIQGVAEGTH